MGIFIDKGGYLYVADTWDHRIQKIDLKDANYPIVRAYGKNGNDNDEFQYPRSIFVDDNTDIYVADTNSHRIKIFQQHIIVPTAPTITATTPDVTEMRLTWTAASRRTGGSVIDKYVVEFKKTTATNWKSVDILDETSRTATITDLDANTEYQFRVFAHNTA